MALSQACMDSKLALCVVVSDTGEAANAVTKYRPPVPVMVVSAQPPVVAQRELCFGQVRVVLWRCACEDDVYTYASGHVEGWLWDNTSGHPGWVRLRHVAVHAEPLRRGLHRAQVTSWLALGPCLLNPP